MPLRIAFRTFGCKLNQSETEAIASAFYDAGAELCGIECEPDIVVFNTCTVTGKAEQKARCDIRGAGKANPQAAIIITGCYAELEAAALMELGERCIVVPGKQKNRLCAAAKALSADCEAGMDMYEAALTRLASNEAEEPFIFAGRKTYFRTRPQLKVQDGCNKRCAYCRVCIARGPSLSLDPDIVVERAVLLEKNGAREIVLSAVNLSQYAHGGIDFSGLLAKLLAGTERALFRLSSYEPDMIDEAFIRVFAEPRIQPHIHLSIQSGSNTVLARMRRGYSADTVINAVRAVRRTKGDIFLGADIITGFPCESEADFADTVALLHEIRPAWIHAFPFSPRPGTEAFSMRPAVPERISKERAAAVQLIAEHGKKAFVQSRLGTRLTAVIEPDGKATSAEYIKLKLTQPADQSEGLCVCFADGLAPPESGCDMYAKVMRFI